MNEIYKKLFINLANKMVEDYKSTRELFEKNGENFHKEEFGIYREKIIKAVLKRYLPTRLDIGSGFIISHKGNVSTQCDLIIYDKTNYHYIEEAGKNFFPVEYVVGVIEVKSRLTPTQLKDALIKLTNIKKMREDIDTTLEPIFLFNYYKRDKFDLENNHWDRISTFLICEEITNYKDDTYEKLFFGTYSGISPTLLHNMILSLKDGLLLYSEKIPELKNRFPYYGRTFNKNNFAEIKPYVLKSDKDNDHICRFIIYFLRLVSQISVIEMDPVDYIYSPEKINK